MEVPTFKQYYPTIDAMNDRQREFYDYWRDRFENGVIIGVDGQVSYLYCYAYSLLKLEPKVAVNKLKNLAIAFGNEDTFLCQKWISDCYVLLKDYRSAIENFPTVPISSRSTWATNDLLSLKLLIGERVSGRDILTLYGPNVTKWGREFLDEIAEYLGVLVASYERETSTNLLLEWVKDCRKYAYSVFGGSFYQKYADIFAYDFTDSMKAMLFINPLTREAENTVREEKGIPKVGEGWVAETTLYYEIRRGFPELKVIHHARPEWLPNQHIDIYIPMLGIAFEFQGLQHDIPVDFFGGEEAFEKVKRRDETKIRKCKKNKVKLVHVRPGYSIEEIYAEIRRKIE